MHSQVGRNSKGLTLLEMVMIMAILLVLSSIATFSIQAYRDWQAGLKAGEAVKAVYQAQRLYLADNPTTALSAITEPDITPYLPAGYNGAMPVVDGLDGENLGFIIDQSPPYLHDDTDNRYDPSGSTVDSLWDAGQ